jgi:hypothetical protein
MLRRNGLIPTPTFIRQELSGGGPCIDIGVHILDLTLWMMGNPRPVAVTGVARAELAHRDGAWAVWRDAPIPQDFDVEDFASAFVRFENGATLMLEVSWLLHRDTDGEDMQMWLYGTEGGSHWPKCEVYHTNYATRQLYNRALQLSQRYAGAPCSRVCGLCGGCLQRQIFAGCRQSSRCRCCRSWMASIAASAEGVKLRFRPRLAQRSWRAEMAVNLGWWGRPTSIPPTLSSGSWRAAMCGSAIFGITTLRERSVGRPSWGHSRWGTPAAIWEDRVD